MSLSNLISATKIYWQKRIVRIAIAALVLGGAVYAQYLLARIPLSVDVGQSKPPYNPMSAAFVNREELTLEKPSLQTANDADEVLLMSDEGSESVSVEAHFASARLHDEILNLLRTSTRPMPSSGLQQIVYVTEGASGHDPAATATSSGTPCRTSIRISLLDESKVPSEIRFFQPEGPGTTRYRTLGMSVQGADLLVQLITRNLNKEGRPQIAGPGCTKTLSLGDWSDTFASPVPLKIILPAGTRLQLVFAPLPGKTGWSGSEGLFEAFELESSPLAVHSISQVSNNQAAFSATNSEEEHPLVLKHLKIGSGELQVEYAGKAILKENGKAAVTFDLWEFIKKNPLLAAILGALDAALLAWIKRIGFKSTT